MNKQINKAKSDALFKMNVDLTKAVKRGLVAQSVEQIDGTLNAYIRLMNPPVEADQDKIEVEVEVLKQLALFATIALSNLYVQRLRNS